MEVQIHFLDAVNRLSKVGLMVRESLDPGSRFYCIMMTPSDVPCHDGSGNGANDVQATCRDMTNGPVKVMERFGEAPVAAFPSWLKLVRNEDRMIATYKTNEFSSGTQFSAWLTNLAFSDKVFFGIAITSANNNSGFMTSARFGPLYLDFPEPIFDPMVVRRSEGGLTILWSSLSGSVLQSSSQLDPLAQWSFVTNTPLVLSNRLLSITIPVITNASRFFRLKNGLFDCLQD
jgi:hypothetical protein